MENMLGHGIFAADGENWYFQRKIGSRVFTTRAFKDIFETVFAENIDKLVSLLSDRASTGETIDMHDVFHRFFMDSFGQIAFGLDIGSLSMKDVPFATAFDRCQEAVTNRFLSPIARVEEVFKPIVKKSFQTVRDFGLKVIKDKQSGVLKGKEADLLSLFMAFRDDEGAPLTDEQLVDQV